MKVPLLDLRKQYQKIRREIGREIGKVLDRQIFILGPTVAAFEKELAVYCEVPYAIGVASGTDALLLSLMALGVSAGDRVLTVSYTFFATGGSISTLGAKPIFVEIDPQTYNMDPNHLEDTLKKIRRKADRPKAIMPVHLFGQMADMNAIMNIAGQHGIPVVEDAAQALGACQKGGSPSDREAGNHGRVAGALGDLGCFSFYPSKNLGGFGDGGMVITRNPELAEKVRILRVHGGKTKYHHEVIGINSRLDALQAAILRVKLKYLNQWSRARRRNAERYALLFRKAGLKPPKIRLPHTVQGNYHIFNQFVIRARKRDELRQYLTREGIGSEVYYPIPLHLQICYRDLGYHPGDLPVSEKAAKETLALPIYPELTLGRQRKVVQAIRDFYSGS